MGTALAINFTFALLFIGLWAGAVWLTHQMLGRRPALAVERPTRLRAEEQRWEEDPAA